MKQLKALIYLQKIAIDSLDGSITKNKWEIIKNNESITKAINDYNEKYNPDITVESLGKLIGIK